MALVERVKGILLEPKSEWTRIAAEPATPQSIYVGYVLILAAIGPIAALVGYSALGSAFAVRIAIGQYVLALVLVAVLALIIDGVAPSFGGTKDFVAALKLASYSYTAAWLAGIFHLLGSVGGVLILIASVYSWYTFYLGAPLLKKATPEKALPLTIVIVLCGLVFGILAGVAFTNAGFAPPYRGMM